MQGGGNESDMELWNFSHIRKMITGAEVPFVAVFFFPFDFAKFSKTDFVWNDFNN